MEEKIFLEQRDQNGTIFVSSARVMIYEKTYSTANITSVSSHQGFHTDENKLRDYFVIFATGVIIFLILKNVLPASSFYWVFVVLGTTVGGAFIGGIISAALEKNTPYYYVNLGSASGEIEAHWSYDPNWIQPIVTAVNDAIIYVSQKKEVLETSGFEATIECPECAETIKAKAKKCRFCGSSLDVQPA